MPAIIDIQIRFQIASVRSPVPNQLQPAARYKQYAQKFPLSHHPNRTTKFGDLGVSSHLNSLQYQRHLQTQDHPLFPAKAGSRSSLLEACRQWGQICEYSRLIESTDDLAIEHLRLDFSIFQVLSVGLLAMLDSCIGNVPSTNIGSPT